MTVKELLDIKYNEWMLRMKPSEWNNIKYYSEHKQIRIPEYMYLCLEITQNDIKQYGGYNGELYKEITQMYDSKLLASNKHRQEHGHIDRWWLTNKGIKRYKETI